MFALRAAGIVAVFASNFLPFLALIVWGAWWDPEFRRGMLFTLGMPVGTSSIMPIVAFCSFIFFAPVYVFFVAWGSNGENIDADTLRSAARYHPGRVYFIYPYRFVRY